MKKTVTKGKTHSKKDALAESYKLVVMLGGIIDDMKRGEAPPSISELEFLCGLATNVYGFIEEI